MIGSLKGKSAIAIARPFAGHDRNFAGEHFWARGYAVSTVGVALEQVRAYIRDQEDADGAGRFEHLNSNRPPLRRSCSSSHRLCRGCLTLWGLILSPYPTSPSPCSMHGVGTYYTSGVLRRVFQIHKLSSRGYNASRIIKINPTFFQECPWISPLTKAVYGAEILGISTFTNSIL